MFNASFSGLRLSAAALIVFLITAGLYFGACSSDKGEKKETGKETQTVETPAQPSSSETTSGTGQDKGTKSHGPPPEITEPCKSLTKGDDCTVTITDGTIVEGSCVSMRTGILACMPKPRVGDKKAIPPSSSDKNAE